MTATLPDRRSGRSAGVTSTTKPATLSVPPNKLVRVSNTCSIELRTISQVISAAVQLGAGTLGAYSEAEQRVVDAVGHHQLDIGPIADQIRAGGDPLGDAFARIKSAEQRRPLGQTYTPPAVVSSMLTWAAQQADTPDTVIDAGAGSGRYIIEAARRFPDAALVAVDVDPVATLMTRAAVAVTGNAGRATVTTGDFRALTVAGDAGRVLWTGNPPFVRHHQIDQAWKRWFTATAKSIGVDASALAGLHAYFYLAVAVHGRPGDLGTFITSAEWLDVNYGKLIRQLLLEHLGASAVHVLEPTAEVFPDAQTTGAITCFRVGDKPTSVKLRRVKTVDQLDDLTGGRAVARQRLTEANRWSVLTRVTPKLAEGYVELGELCSVHRGAVTGANAVWVRKRSGVELPERVLFPSVTRARELFAAGAALSDASKLRVVVDLPVDLDALDEDEARLVKKFLAAAKKAGVDEGYVASNRRAWWRVGLRAPAPILATYMARRPPAFVRNTAAARHINIAHGIYPREPLPAAVLDRLADHLRVSVTVGQGRTYAGGLTKFEPREMERLTVPNPEMLRASA